MSFGMPSIFGAPATSSPTGQPGMATMKYSGAVSPGGQIGTIPPLLNRKETAKPAPKAPAKPAAKAAAKVKAAPKAKAVAAKVKATAKAKAAAAKKKK